MISGKILIANRGEIATRIARAAAELGLAAVAIFPEDDATSLHTRKTGQAICIPGRGAAAYLDGDAVIHAAQEAGANAIHPGYGFLSENADFAHFFP
jgi:acetyl/propionyl-CoA carboxylase alpha subunit